MSFDNSSNVRGNLARDPEVRYSASGKAFATGAVAIYEGKDKPASFVDFICFGELAENVGESLSKGDRVSISGTLTQDRWEDDEGNKRSKVKIVAEDVAVSLRWATATIHKEERWNGPADDDLI